MMLAGMDLEHLTETERDQILQVLHRDDHLRQREQDRIRKLRNDVKRLRLKGVIRDGQDADKTCARCRQPFGWIFNKGALCANCQHRVCDKCREKKDGESWICVLCFKQMELEAMTNHWFYSKFRKSKRNKKTNQVVSGSELIRSSFRRPGHGTQLAGNSLTEEVKRALSNNNSAPEKKSPGRARSPEAGETSDTQSTEGMTPSQRVDAAAFPQDEDKQLLMELIKPRGHSPNGPLISQHHVQVQRVTSNRYRESDSDSDSMPSTPPHSSRDNSMFTHTDSLRSSIRSSSAVSSEGRITIVTDIGGMSDMEVASVDIPMMHHQPELTHQDVERYVSDPRSYGYNDAMIRGGAPAAGRLSNDPRDQYMENHTRRREPVGSYTTDSHRNSLHSDNKHRDGSYRDSPHRDSSHRDGSHRDSPRSSHRGSSHGSQKQNSHRNSPHGSQRDGSHREGSHRNSPHGSHRDGSHRDMSRLDSPSRGSPQSSRSSHGTNRSHRSSHQGGDRRARDLVTLEVHSGSSDSDTVYKDKSLRHRTKLNERSRTPSPEAQLLIAARNREMHTSSGAVGNGHLAPPGGVHRNQSPREDDQSTQTAFSPAPLTPPSDVSSQHSLSGDVRSTTNSVPSMSATASPISNRLNTSVPETEEDDNIDEMFASHVSMTSVADSKRSSNMLSPFSTSRESIASYYSDAGEGNYGNITVTGEILFGLDYNYKSNLFEICIKQCRDLAMADTKRRRSDPYIKTYLLPDKTKSGKRKTRVKKHTMNPSFDETLRYNITKSELENRTVWLTVWHNDTFGRNDFLGEINIPMDDYSFSNSTPRWHTLQERHVNPMSKMTYKGDLVVSLKFVTCDHVMNKRRSRGSERGELHVLVKEGRNLTALRANGTSDPFCKGYLLPEKTKHAKQKTSVKKKDCNPKWNHTFVFEDIAWADLKERCLELSVWDHDRFTSNDFLGGVRLGIGTGTSGGRAVDWMDSMGEEITAWQSMLDRPNTWIDSTLQLRSNMDGRH